MIGEDLLAVRQRMLHQRRLARSRLALDAEHPVVRCEVGARPPSFELGGAEQPVACVVDGGAYVMLAVVDLEEAEGAEAGCEALAFWTDDRRSSRGRHAPS